MKHIKNNKSMVLTRNAHNGLRALLTFSGLSGSKLVKFILPGGPAELLTVKSSRRILTACQKSVVSRFREVIIPLCSALMRAYLKYDVPFLSPDTKKVLTSQSESSR